jgi:hypothetical protein
MSNKKIRLLNQELLKNSGGIAELRDGATAGNSRWGASLVRIPPQTWVNEIEKEKNGRDVIRTRDPRHVKV